MISYNVYKIDNHNPIYGPYKRTVIWFCGCSIHCKGCINPELWKRKSIYDISFEDLILKIDDEHVTLLGGEPLDQENILYLIKYLKEKNIGIILFTGYSLSKINGIKLEAASLCDVVVSEPFDKNQIDNTLYLRGSTNQIINFNSPLYNEYDFSKKNSKLIKINDSVELFGRDKMLINDLLEL